MNKEDMNPVMYGISKIECKVQMITSQKFQNFCSYLLSQLFEMPLMVKDTDVLYIVHLKTTSLCTCLQTKVINSPRHYRVLSKIFCLGGGGRSRS